MKRTTMLFAIGALVVLASGAAVPSADTNEKTNTYSGTYQSGTYGHGYRGGMGTGMMYGY